MFADELRLGLHGQVRRCWTLRGVKLRHKVQIRYVWRYLLLGVSASGTLLWQWIDRCRKEEITEVIVGWHNDEQVGAIVWDNAPSHRANHTRSAGVPLIPLPAYAPELNPAERVFEDRKSVV